MARQHTTRARLSERFTHQGVVVSISSKLADDEPEFIRKAIDTAFESVPATEQMVNTVTYVRAERVHHPHWSEDERRYLDYMGSGGSYNFRRDSAIGGNIRVAAGLCIDEAIGVLCHELAHAQHAALYGRSKKGEPVHTPQFWTLAANLYLEMGCTEVPPLHDMIYQKGARRIHLHHFPEHRAWHSRLLMLRDIREYGQIADELERVLGPLERE